MEPFLNIFQSHTCDDVSFIIFSYWQEDCSPIFKTLCEKRDTASLYKLVEVANFDRKNPVYFAYACATGDVKLVKRLVTKGFALENTEGYDKVNIENRIKKNPSVEMLDFLKDKIKIQLLLDSILLKALKTENYGLASFCVQENQNLYLGKNTIGTLLEECNFKQAAWLIRNYGSRLEKCSYFSPDVKHKPVPPDNLIIMLANGNLLEEQSFPCLYNKLCFNMRFDIASFLLSKFEYLRPSLDVIEYAFVICNVPLIQWLVSIGADFKGANPINYNNQIDSKNKFLLYHVPNEVYTPDGDTLCEIFRKIFDYGQKRYLFDLIIEKKYPLPEECLVTMNNKYKKEYFLEVLRLLKSVSHLSLIAAAAVNDPNLIKAVIERGVDPMRIVDLGRCVKRAIIMACEVAIKYDNEKSLEYLIDLGGETMKDWLDILIIGVESKKIQDLLLSKGAHLSVHARGFRDSVLDLGAAVASGIHSFFGKQ